MEIQQYLSQKKDIQKGLLSFIECEHEIEEKYINLINIIKDQKIQQDPQELQMFLSLLVNITNHKRTSNFYERLEKILFMFQNEIKQSFSNFQIFHIFRKNKRLLLFLLKEKNSAEAQILKIEEVNITISIIEIVSLVIIVKKRN